MKMAGLFIFELAKKIVGFDVAESSQRGMLQDEISDFGDEWIQSVVLVNVRVRLA